MSLFARSILLGFLCAVIGCASNPTIYFRKDVYPFKEDNARIDRISANSPKEIHFLFSDNVALFWRVHHEKSYMRHNSFEHIKIKTRPGYNEDESKRGIDIYVSRADDKPFEHGRYSFHLVLDAAYPEYPKYKVQSIQTGAFSLRYVLWCGRSSNR